MEITLKILLVLFSIGLITVVLLQKGKSAGLSGAITGGAEHLFGKQKARGLDLFLQRLTVAFAVGFLFCHLLFHISFKNNKTSVKSEDFPRFFVFPGNSGCTTSISCILHGI